MEVRAANCDLDYIGASEGRWERLRQLVVMGGFRMSHWRVSDMALGLLTALAVLAAWEGYSLNHRPETSGCGGDFSQFYTAGMIVARGESARLYDQDYFKHFQAWMREDPLRSLYPPTMGMAMSPLARLPYRAALAAWWAIQLACLAACGIIFYRTTPLARHWRINVVVALAALLPLWIAIGIGHLAPILLLILTVGLTLHRQGRRMPAGAVLSLLAVKPQLVVGLILWMLLRRDWRTLAGLALGGTMQIVVVAAVLGPGIWLDYLHELPRIAAMTREYTYSPLFEQSFAGIASNLCNAAGLESVKIPAMRVVYAITTAIAAVALCRVVAARRPFGEIPCHRSNTTKKNYEYACGVLFMAIFPPYFLVYDQTLFAYALVMLWASPGWRWGVLLLAVSSLPIANLSFALGFSVTGVVALTTMVSLARELSRVSSRSKGTLQATGLQIQ
jgi:hypothetical protein